MREKDGSSLVFGSFLKDLSYVKLTPSTSSRAIRSSLKFLKTPCSGCDFFAAALYDMQPGFVYEHAAECDTVVQAVLRDAWDDPDTTLWEPPYPLLSIWVTRDLQTVPLYVEARCEDEDFGASGENSLGIYQDLEPPEIPHLSSVFNSPIRDATLHAEFDEANGSLKLFMDTWSEGSDDPDGWAATSILEYLDALVPRSSTP